MYEQRSPDSRLLTTESIVEKLTSVSADYELNTVCQFHDDADNLFCALGKVKKFA